MPKQNQNKVQCGLIGLGRWGKNYLRLLQDTAGATLRASATHANVSDIFSDPEIDAVFIVTPPSTHYSLIETGLKAGKHVFVEKPMVLNVSDANKLKTLVATSGKIFMVGFQYLFNENIRHIKEEIGKETFGKIISVASEHILSPSRPDVDIFWDAAPHPLSVFQYLFSPEKLTAVEGKMEHDSASVRVEFANAPTLEIVTSSFGQTKVRKLTVVGEKATAVLDETLGKNNLAFTRNSVKGSGTFDLQRYLTPLPKEPLRTEVEHFIHCVQTGETPLTDINFGSQITEWLEAISKQVAKQ